MKRRRIAWTSDSGILIIGLLLVKVAKWVPDTFGDIPFE